MVMVKFFLFPHICFRILSPLLNNLFRKYLDVILYVFTENTLLFHFDSPKNYSDISHKPIVDISFDGSHCYSTRIDLTAALHLNVKLV